MNQALELRFKKRNDLFVDVLTSVKSEMNARGLLYSGATVKKAHAAMEDELEEARSIIVQTFSDYLLINRPSQVRASEVGAFTGLFEERRRNIESIFDQHMRIVIDGLSNNKALAPFLTLDAEMPGHIKELEVALARGKSDYITSRGKTLFERVKNQFLDRPLVVIAVITMTSVTTILAFIKLLGGFGACS